MEAVAEAVNPWLSIWTRPRATVRHLVHRGAGPMVLVLAALGGISQFLDRAMWLSLGDAYSTTSILLMAILLGPAFGLVGLYIGAWLIAWTGRWIGGDASAAEVRIALAWGTVPIVFGLGVWAFDLAVFGGELFTTFMPRVEANPALALLMMISGLVSLTLAIWSLVIVFKGIGEVQGFSAWKAIGNVLLAGLPLVALGVLAAIVLPALA